MLVTGKVKRTISILLLVTFMLPVIAKVAHTHNHHSLDAANAAASHLFQEKCSICNFEFPAFLAVSVIMDLPAEKPSDNYSNNFTSLFRSGLSGFSFLLRAPPLQEA
jgi:hypothetical protein